MSMDYGWGTESRDELSVRERADRGLLRAVDASLAGCVFVVPLLLGGRIAAGHFLLVTLAVLAAAAWCCRCALRRGGRLRLSGAEWLIVAAMAWLLFQMIPLPHGLWQQLTPQSAEILPLWVSSSNAPFHLGQWSRLTLAPNETRLDWILFASYALIFLVTIQRVNRVEDVERILRWLAYAAIGFAILGLAQYFFGNDKYFWVYEHPYSKLDDAVKGGFTSRNHFAHFLALAAGPLLWWLQAAVRRRSAGRNFQTRRTASSGFTLGLGGRAVLVAVVVFAVLLSLSRGGIAALLIAASLTLVACYRTGRINGRFLAGSLAGTGLVAAGLTIFGFEQVSHRLSDLTTLSWEEVDHHEARSTVWRHTLEAASDFWFTGSGAGSFQHVYSRYQPFREGNHYYTHAENGYLQVLLELGLPGLLMLLLGIALCGRWAWRIWRRRPGPRLALPAAVIAIALLISVLHSLVDFVWYVPAIAAVVAILIACLCRLDGLTAAAEKPSPEAFRHSGTTLPPRAWAVAATTVILAGGWMIHDRAGPAVADLHWQRYLVLSRTVAPNEDDFAEIVKPDDSSFGGDLTGADDGLAPDAAAADESAAPGRSRSERRRAAMVTERRLAAELELVVKYDPGHTMAHLRLAQSYLRLFQLHQAEAPNPFSLMDICEVASGNDSQFTSREELDAWMQRAFGDHVEYLDKAWREAYRAAALCPLHARAYLCLSDLSFLYGMDRQGKQALIEQAVRAQPYDGIVLLQAGDEAARAAIGAGSPESQMEGFQKCLEYWRRAYAAGRPYQYQLVDRWLAAPSSAPMQAWTELFLDRFEPDLEIVRYMYRQYRSRATTEELRPLQEAYLARLEEAIGKAESSADKADLWIDAHYVLREMERPVEALAYARRALECDPSSYRVRHYLARCLEENGLYAEAEEHLRWCLQRRPGHKGLQQEVVRLREAALESNTPETATVKAPITR